MAKENDAAIQAEGKPQAEAKASPVSAPKATTAPAGNATASAGVDPNAPKRKKTPGKPPRRGKKLRNILKNIEKRVGDAGQIPLKQGLVLLKQIKRAKFDETVELHINLGIDSTQSDQMVRGSVPLPHGLGKTVRVVVFCQGENVAKAKAAGADYAGSADLVEKIQKENWLDFDCNGDYDLDACACGGGSSTPGTLNQPCDFNFDCGTDEACFIGYGATASDPGACKTTCATAADCTAGQDCMIGGWVGDLGFCADIRFPGDACDAAVFSVDIGFDAMCDGSDDAVIFDCFSGRCEQVCDWAGNTGAEQSCNAGSCGNLAFHAEAGGDVAVCE